MYVFVCEGKRDTSRLFYMIGALRNAHLVTGPCEDRIPAVPHTEQVVMAHELIGTGFIRTGDDGPAIHIHSSVGRRNHAMTGCLRDNAEAFLLIEVMIIECVGMVIPLAYNPDADMMLPYPE
jgi:predicted DNA-binding protein with PD1-like motif